MNDVSPEQLETKSDGVDVSALSQLLSFHLRMLVLEVNRAYDRAFDGTAVAGGTGKLTTMMLVAANPGISQGRVGAVMSKDRPAMVRIVDHLEHAGLLRRARPPGERRRYGLWLTPRGQTKVAEYMRMAVDYDEAFFGVLSTRERSDLARILRKLRKTYQGETLGANADGSE